MVGMAVVVLSVPHMFLFPSTADFGLCTFAIVAVPVYSHLLTWNLFGQWLYVNPLQPWSFGETWFVLGAPQFSRDNRCLSSHYLVAILEAGFKLLDKGCTQVSDVFAILGQHAQEVYYNIAS